MREISITNLYYLAQQFNGDIDCLYLHWTAGWNGQFFDDYHINIDGDGTVYLSTDDLSQKLAHTWHRNSRAVGISMACCATAQYDGLNTRWGECPPSSAQIEAMAKVVDVLCAALGLPIDYDHVKTHSEAADEDGYGPETTCERWDLKVLPDYSTSDNADEAKNTDGGDLIRGKANWYKQHGY